MTIAQKVIKILEEYEATRDNDQILYVEYCEREGISPNEIGYKMKEGDAPSYEAVTRCRRKLQEENEYLRGEKHTQRKKAAKDRTWGKWFS